MHWQATVTVLDVHHARPRAGAAPDGSVRVDHTLNSKHWQSRKQM